MPAVEASLNPYQGLKRVIGITKSSWDTYGFELKLHLIPIRD